MQEWIHSELNTRCHPTRLAVRCERNRLYDSFVPCVQELMNHLAEDYSVMRGWCNFSKASAAVPALQGVDPAAYAAFNQPPLQAQ